MAPLKCIAQHSIPQPAGRFHATAFSVAKVCKQKGKKKNTTMPAQCRTQKNILKKALPPAFSQLTPTGCKQSSSCRHLCAGCRFSHHYLVNRTESNGSSQEGNFSKMLLSLTEVESYWHCSFCLKCLACTSLINRYMTT